MKPITDHMAAPARNGSAVVEVIPLTFEQVLEREGITRLDTLTGEHLTGSDRQQFEQVLQQVRALRYSPEFSGLILTSPQVGIGKTHIAKAVKDSYAEVVTGSDPDYKLINGKPNFAVIHKAIFRTAKEIINPPEGEFKPYICKPDTKCVVIDDIGREGRLRYVSSDEQEHERQARYFELVNHIYETGAALVLTTNMTVDELQGFFNPPTWSRIMAMCKAGSVIGMPALPDYRMVQGGRNG